MALRMTEEEFAAFERRRKGGNILRPEVRPDTPEPSTPPPKRSKYGNRKIEIDGMKFDSVHEADVYLGLALRMKAGELKCVCRQVPFDLPGGIKYIADFVTIRPDMTIEGVYDAKSPATRKDRVYINKRKQMKACWDIEIQEV